MIVPFQACRCLLRVFAVGGGGQAGANGGAGSGYFKYETHLLSTDKDSMIDLYVGGQSQDSWISINQGDVTVASAGNDSHSWDGANGYCGGGAVGDWYPHNGGANGGNGEGGDNGYQGGNGSGEDINAPSIKLDNFMLSPGAGGQAYDMGSYSRGGGGGGILVNGEGPQQDSEYGQGEGFGGGGGLHINNDGVQTGDGSPGVVLIEVL